LIGTKIGDPEWHNGPYFALFHWIRKLWGILPLCQCGWRWTGYIVCRSYTCYV